MSIFLHPEILRIKLNSLRRTNKEYVVALPYLLQAISNLFLSMPITKLKYVKVKFYRTGLLTVVKKEKRIGFGLFTRKSDDVLSVPLYNNEKSFVEYDKSNFDRYQENEIESLTRENTQNEKIFQKKPQNIWTPFKVSLVEKMKYKNLYAEKSYLNRQRTKSSVYKDILHSSFFFDTEIDWLEAGLQLIKQAHIILSSILYAKDLSFYSLDFNFNLVQVREITTKERKRGRVGLTFHFIRELCKIIKCILDSHIAYRSDLIDENKHLNTIYDILTGLGKYSGIYRYKYRIMKQINECKLIRKEDQKNGTLSMDKLFKIWQSFFRGHIPLFHKFGLNLTRRILLKREKHPKTVSKQRIETFQELYTRDMLLAETNNKNALAHLTEAWRCYKSCLEYSSNNQELDSILSKYLKEKAKRYKQQTIEIRKSIFNKNVEKSLQRKNIGRITRLFLLQEAKKQNLIMNNPLPINESVEFYKIYKKVLKDVFIPFPSSILDDKIEKKLNESLEQRIYNEMISNFKSEDGEILSISKIKEYLLHKRVFSEIEVSLRDNIDNAYFYYKYENEERQIDSFLDLWISHFYHKEEEFFIVNLRKLQKYTFFTTFSINYEKFDLNLLYHILSIFMDKSLVEYIISRCNCVYNYKDISLVNRIGIPKAFEFSHILYSLLYSLIDYFLDQNDIFYIREDEKIIIASNKKLFTEKELNEMIENSFQSIFQFKNVLQSTNSFEFFNCIYKNGKIELQNVRFFRNKIRNINSNQSFVKIIEQWNYNLLSLAVTFREFITDTQIEEILKLEKRMKNLIKGHINSKMPVRFPNLIFYVPIELGGLGMLSMSKKIISILDYINSWNKIEIQENKIISSFIKNIRIRQRYRKYFLSENSFFRFTPQDGKMWSISKYKYDMIDLYGGAQKILEKSIISRINNSFDTKMLWETQTYKLMTKAQLSGAKLYPNKKFIFFWSTLINTSNVYIGYPTYIDRSGIVMYGKLASLKISYIKIFRDKLWIRICENFVTKFAELNHCKKCTVDKKKWYFGSGIDTVFNNCVFHEQTIFYNQMIKTRESLNFCEFQQGDLWMDLQVRWSNYDSPSIQKYAKSRYEDIISDPLNKDRTKMGFVVAIDILYKEIEVYGYMPTNLKLPKLGTIKEYDLLKKRILKVLGLNTDLKIYDIKDFMKKPCQYEEFIFDAKRGILTIEKEEILNDNYIKLDQTDGMRSKCKIFFPALRTLLNEETKSELSYGEDKINLYKNWNYEAFTNFCRLVLILNAYRISRNKVLEIKNLFGQKSDEELILIEHKFKNIIIDKFSEERNIKRLFSPTETRDIVFGKEIELFKNINFRTRDKIGIEIEKNIQTTAVEVSFEEEWITKFKDIISNKNEEFNRNKNEEFIKNAIDSSNVNKKEGLNNNRREDKTIKTDVKNHNQLRLYAMKNRIIKPNSNCLKKLNDIATSFELFVWIVEGNVQIYAENTSCYDISESNTDLFFALPPQSCRNGVLRLPQNLSLPKNQILGFILLNTQKENFHSFLQKKYFLNTSFTEEDEMKFDNQKEYYFLVPNVGYNFYFRHFDENIKYHYQLSLPAHFMDLEHRVNEK